MNVMLQYISVLLMYVYVLVSSSSSTMSSSLPVTSLTCTAATSVCPTSAAAVTQLSDESNTASENYDMALHCDAVKHYDSPIDNLVDRIDGTGHTFQTADPGKTQTSLSTSHVFTADDSRQLRPLFPTTQAFVAAETEQRGRPFQTSQSCPVTDRKSHSSLPTEQPRHLFQTSLSCPVTDRKSHSSLPTGQAFVLADARNSQPSLSSSSVNTFSSVGSAQSQQSGTSAVISDTSLTYGAMKCEPTVSATASVSHVHIYQRLLS